MDGQTSMAKRHDLVQQFQEVNEIRIALLGISATGIGLTLTAASTILFAEMHWTPAIMLQAEDRAHRIGQVNSVNCHYLYGSGTLDDKLYMKLDQKLGIVSEMIDGLRKDLEVENNLKKGDIGAISIDKTLGNKTKVIKNHNNNPINEMDPSDKKEKITSFFEVVGVKSSNANTEEKKKMDVNAKISVDKCFNTMSSIPKENHSDCSEIPDLELLDKLVDEFNKSEKKPEQEIKEKTQMELKEKKERKLFSIEQMREVLKKEFKNNLVEGNEFIIESNENSMNKFPNEYSNGTIVLDEVLDKTLIKKPLENIENIRKEAEASSGKMEEGSKRKRNENEKLRESDQKFMKKLQIFKPNDVE